MIADDAAARAAAALAEPGSSWRNEVVARSIFTFDEYNPAVQAASLEAPLLLVASRADRFAPYSAVETFARAHPRARIAEIEGDHFDVYLPPARERAAALAAEFLAQELAPAD